MSNANANREIPCDRKLAAEFAAMIDGTDFGTIKRYLRSPASPISLVVILSHEYRLEQLAAVFVKGNSKLANELATVKRALTVASDLPPLLAGDVCHVLLDSIPDEQYCDVIYLPPAYLVQLRPM